MNQVVDEEANEWYVAAAAHALLALTYITKLVLCGKELLIT